MGAYHHGDLRQALLEAGRAIIEEQGPEGFSLREAARRAGVSPAAPSHHFGDAAGLLNAIAGRGFADLEKALRRALQRPSQRPLQQPLQQPSQPGRNSSGERDPRAGLVDQGCAYVLFAHANPGVFRLMFRPSARRDDPELSAQARAAFAQLMSGVQALPEQTEDDQRRTAAALWSLVHGFAHLLIAEQMQGLSGPLRSRAAITGALEPLIDQLLGPRSRPGS